MPKKSPKNTEVPAALSRRKRQILDAVYAIGQANQQADVQAVLAALPDPPSYSAVRATLNNMVEEGVLTHAQAGRKLVYAPAHSRASAAAQAAKRLLSTFFGGSVSRAVEGLLDAADHELPPEEVAQLAQLIRSAKQRGEK